jgi:hypothetical protein
MLLPPIWTLLSIARPTEAQNACWLHYKGHTNTERTSLICIYSSYENPHRRVTQVLLGFISDKHYIFVIYTPRVK